MRLDETHFSKEDLLAKVEDAIENIIRTEAYITYEVTRKPLSTDGGNYLAELYEVDIKGTYSNGRKETNLFLKNMIPETQIGVVKMTEAYTNEIYCYSDLFKVFDELQNEVSIPEDERYTTVKYYTQCDGKAIIFENLSKKGFGTLHRMDVMPLKFAEQSIKNLARFHALSFALEKMRPEYFKRRNIKLKKIPYIFGKETMDLQESAMNYVKMVSKGDVSIKLEKFYKTMYEKFYRYMTEPTFVSTLCHGDYRPNNIMVKYRNGEVFKVIPVDYQMLYYGCPMNDFLYFIFSGTDQDFRRKHLESLKDLYYDTLSAFLKYFDIDSQVVYPRKLFEKYYNERLDHGLMIAIILTPFLFVLEDDVQNFSTASLTQSVASLRLDPIFEERILGLLEDFIAWGYL